MKSLGTFCLLGRMVEIPAVEINPIVRIAKAIVTRAINSVMICDYQLLNPFLHLVLERYVL